MAATKNSTSWLSTLRMPKSSFGLVRRPWQVEVAKAPWALATDGIAVACVRGRGASRLPSLQKQDVYRFKDLLSPEPFSTFVIPAEHLKRDVDYGALIKFVGADGLPGWWKATVPCDEPCHRSCEEPRSGVCYHCRGKNDILKPRLGRFFGHFYNLNRLEELLRHLEADKVTVMHLEKESSTPIYIIAKDWRVGVAALLHATSNAYTAELFEGALEFKF